MTKIEILKLYIGDLESKIVVSPARNNRIAMLKDELKSTLNIDLVVDKLRAISAQKYK